MQITFSLSAFFARVASPIPPGFSVECLSMDRLFTPSVLSFPNLIIYLIHPLTPRLYLFLSLSFLVVSVIPIFSFSLFYFLITLFIIIISLSSLSCLFLNIILFFSSFSCSLSCFFLGFSKENWILNSQEFWPSVFYVWKWPWVWPWSVL